MRLGKEEDKETRAQKQGRSLPWWVGLMLVVRPVGIEYKTEWGKGKKS
jgi:hypothetical protein